MLKYQTVTTPNAGKRLHQLEIANMVASWVPMMIMKLGCCHTHSHHVPGSMTLLRFPEQGHENR